MWRELKPAALMIPKVAVSRKSLADRQKLVDEGWVITAGLIPTSWQFVYLVTILGRLSISQICIVIILRWLILQASIAINPRNGDFWMKNGDSSQKGAREHDTRLYGSVSAVADESRQLIWGACIDVKSKWNDCVQSQSERINDDRNIKWRSRVLADDLGALVGSALSRLVWMKRLWREPWLLVAPTEASIWTYWRQMAGLIVWECHQWVKLSETMSPSPHK